MFIDEVAISVRAGDGGAGAVSFRREKYVPKGGPDGGDGGAGGNVFIQASRSTHGLSRYRGQNNFKAVDGERGGRNKRHGADGDDLVLLVPLGTRIQLINGENQSLIADLINQGDSITVARGGRGGRGNWHFRGPTNQTPRQAEPGTPGETLKLVLELQLIAEVGLIGLPNAGKSTLLSIISEARPKIGDYPFTTLEPQLGVVNWQEHSWVVADLPGLIAGAAGGRGLGHEFLRHVERTRLLVHLVSATEDDPDQAYQTVREELSQFDPAFSIKPELIVITKKELMPKWPKAHAQFIKKYHPVVISAARSEGLDELLSAINLHLV